MAKWCNGPGWTIDQAMEALALLHKPFRENGYALAMHGSVSRDGTGNDLDLVAVPQELCVTPPEQMERIMCDLLGASPAQDEPNHGLLRTWSRTCVLKDGRGIDMEYRIPAPVDQRHEWVSSLVTLFWNNGYYLEFFSFPQRIDAHDYELIALPVAANATSPATMDGLMLEQFEEQLSSPPVGGSVSVHVYGSGDGRKLAIRFVAPTLNGPREKKAD